MAWVSLIIKTNASQAELLSDMLMEQGALSVDIHDAAADSRDEQMSFGEPGEPGVEIWQNAEISALFDQAVDVDAVARCIALDGTITGPLEYRTEQVAEQDWVRLTQSQFEPISISSRLWIVPTWHESPQPDAINLILDPGLAFGTGSHPTTQLCLRWLDEQVQPGDTVIDYGCGSGILAIAALKLGASHVTGIDIDHQAVKASDENARRNACDSAHYRFLSAAHEIERDGQGGQATDIVVANILANPLIVLTPILARAVRHQGAIALSGVLQEQAEDVRRAYQPWFDIGVAGEQEGWVLLTGRKK